VAKRQRQKEVCCVMAVLPDTGTGLYSTVLRLFGAYMRKLQSNDNRLQPPSVFCVSRAWRIVKTEL
jgi:hypothetical protein